MLIKWVRLHAFTMPFFFRLILIKTFHLKSFSSKFIIGSIWNHLCISSRREIKHLNNRWDVRMHKMRVSIKSWQNYSVRDAKLRNIVSFIRAPETDESVVMAYPHVNSYVAFGLTLTNFLLEKWWWLLSLNSHKIVVCIAIGSVDAHTNKFFH